MITDGYGSRPCENGGKVGMSWMELESVSLSTAAQITFKAQSHDLVADTLPCRGRVLLMAVPTARCRRTTYV
ncbi:hypothetical protein BCR44DRAFT_40818 [Catenaria anguillulae PL171]|uniref:Uncharacterized protein n=1 Tax=Catenaria anguillulae PL171 TaxID=765915 RepID=A0A1Y2HNF8_9FUNG|nr:hypothetical protein BCR44DRAFT_40818 [Catenaria anguillulae PL171]